MRGWGPASAPMYLMVALSVCALLPGVVTPPTLAAVEHPAPLVDPRWVAPPTASDVVVTMPPLPPGVAPTESAATRTAHAFVRRHGGQWSFRQDTRSGRLAVAMGSGIELDAGVLRGKALVDADAIEPQVRAFIQRNADWLIPKSGELVYDDERSVARRDGKLITVRYAWHVDGVPVEGAGVFVGINSGKITRVASRLIGAQSDAAIETTPALSASDARRIALTYAGDFELSRIDEPRLVLQPEDSVTDGRSFRLIWKLRHVALGRIETWETRVDATTGRVVGFRDANMYGRAIGGVFPNTVTESNEIRVPLPGLAIYINGVVDMTDTAGRFAYTGGEARTGLNGVHFDTRCIGCNSPEQPFEVKQLGSGRLDLGLAGHDQHGNGRSTAADRNTFYHLAQARRTAIKWLPGLRWLGRTNYPSNVNIPLECNAFYDGQSVNFYRSGGGCNNSGLIRDVVQHEWGHGIDDATILTDGSTAEGTADVVALHMGHNPALGPGFHLDGDPVRVLDSSVNPLGVMTRTRVNSGDCERPLGGISFHCAGLVYGQAAWDLAQALIARHGHRTGWRHSERLFFESLPDAGGMFPDTTMPIYDAYLQADDDDGDLSNGTPHAAEIYAAFAAHEIAGIQAPTSEHCARPAQPTVSVEADCSQVRVTWEQVEGVARYRVLRWELKEESPLFPVARVPAGRTSYVDDEVAPGMDYGYTVLAVDPVGCESTIEQPVRARLIEQPDLEVTGLVVTDAPRGNRSGYPDPGEVFDIALTLKNHGERAGEAIRGTVEVLSEGLTVINGVVDWPALAPGASQEATATLRLATEASPAGVDRAGGDSGGVRCGDLLRLRLTPEGPSTCSGEPSYFQVRIGEPDGNGQYLCDPTPPCFTAPSFDGVQQVIPGASCGETLVAWQPAETHCINATITYDVYRSTDPGFVPDETTLVATGVPETSFADAQLNPGTRYYYMVRAYDSRAAADGNSVVRSVTAPTRPDVKPPRFSGLESAETGENCGEIWLAWSPAAESCSLPVVYDVYRSADDDFSPGPEHRIATTVETSFLDLAPKPGGDFTYVVRARDGVNNVDSNRAVHTAEARILDKVLFHTSFELSEGRWEVTEPNDAVRGNWEWGDPEGSPIQPEDDATLYGANAWITGLLEMLPDGSNNDVDQGTTTLLSFTYDIADAVDPVVRYMRWFTNDRVQNPGDPEDAFLVHASNDGGKTWRLIEEVGPGTPLEWVQVEIPFAGLIRPTDAVQFRFTASDPGFSVLDASGVEAGIDEFELIDRNQGCAGCPEKAEVVQSVQLERAGTDVILIWSADDSSGQDTGGRHYVIERLVGKGLRAERLGTTTATRFTVRNAISGREAQAYRVKSAGSCDPD